MKDQSPGASARGNNQFAGCANREASSTGYPTDLFSEELGPQSIAQQHMDASPHMRAKVAIQRVLLVKHPTQIAYSGGKDSGVVANLVLTAARSIVEQRVPCPMIVVTNIDTQVESPVVRTIVEGEMAKMTTYATRYNIPLQLRVAQPSLSAGFAARVIGGRALPTFPQSRSTDCSVSWKVIPSAKIAAALRRDAGTDSPGLVTVIGTRSSESSARAPKHGHRNLQEFPTLRRCAALPHRGGQFLFRVHMSFSRKSARLLSANGLNRYAVTPPATPV